MFAISDNMVTVVTCSSGERGTGSVHDLGFSKRLCHMSFCDVRHHKHHGSLFLGPDSCTLDMVFKLKMYASFSQIYL